MLDDKPSNIVDVPFDHDWPNTKNITRNTKGLHLQWEHASHELLIDSSWHHTNMILHTRPRLKCVMKKPHSTHEEVSTIANATFDLRPIFEIYWATQDDVGQNLLRFCDENALAAASFFQSLGLDNAVLQSILEFPKSEHIRLLQSAIELGPAFCRRLITQPVIAYMISTSGHFTSTKHVSQQSLCDLKTKDVIACLSLDIPLTAAKKMSPDLCSINNLKILLQLKDKRLRRVLWHLPIWSMPLLELASVCTDKVSPWIGHGLMSQLSDTPLASNSVSIKQTITNITSTAKRLGIRPFRIENLEQLTRLDERMIYAEEERITLECLEFPACPLNFLSSENRFRFIPVNKVQKLYDAAQEFQNCAFQYAWSIATGRYYLYSGHAPDDERILLVLYRAPGHWHPEEVCRVGRAMVADELRKAIYQMVAEVQGLRVDAFDCQR